MAIAIRIYTGQRVRRIREQCAALSKSASLLANSDDKNPPSSERGICLVIPSNFLIEIPIDTLLRSLLLVAAMGLSGRKQKQRIGPDPRNLSWADGLDYLNL